MTADQKRRHSAGAHYKALRRIEILGQTIAALSLSGQRERYRRIALENLQGWREACTDRWADFLVEVKEQDWGVAAGEATRCRGQCYAVLNMANAYLPGGRYLEGAAAQEENMFRRTDCHFTLTDDQIDLRTGHYTEAMSRLIAGKDGRVFLDTKTHRVCIRAAELPERDDLGYRRLNDDEIFPFFELRAAAQNCAHGQDFDAAEARRRIDAQLDTLIAHNQRHAVLGAWGCGAFANPPEIVAALYRDALALRRKAFTHVIFAIINTHPNRDNQRIFANALQSL